MSESQMLSPHDVVAAAHRAILAGDVDGFVRRFAEDAVLEFPSSLQPTIPHRVEGREAIRRAAPALCRRFRRAGGRPWRFEDSIVHETSDADGAGLELEMRGSTSARDGSPGTQVWRVRNGQVLSMRDYPGAEAPRTASPSFGRRGPAGSAWG